MMGLMGRTEDQILKEIPYLRRHARLLTGTQEIGDEFVRLCLELVVAEPHWLEGKDLRVQLFRAFHAAWTRVHETISESAALGAVDLAQRVKGGLAALPGLERRTLLLVVVEGFTYEDTAAILGVSVDEVRHHAAKARSDLLSKVSISTVIIEDEQVVARDIAQIVEEMGHSVVGIAGHEAEAVALVEEARPGLILADIRLEDDGDGVAAARAALETYTVPIVFVTGYPERLLTGTGLEPAFVVAKPFTAEALKVTIAQALATYSAPAQASQHRSALLAKLKEVSAKHLMRSA
jgi:CheY-like chemotaxis protein